MALYSVSILDKETTRSLLLCEITRLPPLTGRFCASLKHKYDGQTKFIKPNSQRKDKIIKYWVSIGSIHREQG